MDNSDTLTTFDWDEYKLDLSKALESVDVDFLNVAFDHLRKTCFAKGVIYVCGNGGSYATASHIVTDLLNAGIHACCPQDNTSWLTATSNDYGYDKALSKYLAAYLKAEDTVVFISCSGTSPNVVKAAITAQGLRVIPIISLTGRFNEEDADNLKVEHLIIASDVCISVDSFDYQIIEDVHMSIMHFLFQRLRSVINPKKD